MKMFWLVSLTILIDVFASIKLIQSITNDYLFVSYQQNIDSFNSFDFVTNKTAISFSEQNHPFRLANDEMIHTAHTHRHIGT